MKTENEKLKIKHMKCHVFPQLTKFEEQCLMNEADSINRSPMLYRDIDIVGLIFDNKTLIFLVKAVVVLMEENGSEFKKIKPNSCSARTALKVIKGKNKYLEVSIYFFNKKTFYRL